MSRWPAAMRFSLGLLVLSFACRAAAPAQVAPQEVLFASNGLQLHGFLWRPEGPGPFPAILWNHGSEKLPGPAPALGQFYSAHSYVFFIPHRRGQGRSPGTYIQDLVAQAPPADRGRRMMELQEAEVSDVVNALQFLRSQPFVDATRVAISGCSYGGIQTLLAGERDLGAIALVPFAPGAMSWGDPLVGQRLVRAVKNAKAPVLLLQAANDFSLEPSRVLGGELARSGMHSAAKVYPAYGTSHDDGHGGFCRRATDVWGADVLTFLSEVAPRT